MTTSQTPPPADQWAIIELMGHIKYGGRIDLTGTMGLLRIDVPRKGLPPVTQLINPASIYRVTMTDEAMATAAAHAGDPLPYSQWELPDLLKGKLIHQQSQLPFRSDADVHDDDDDGEF